MANDIVGEMASRRSKIGPNIRAIAACAGLLGAGCGLGGGPIYIGGSSNSFCDRDKMLEGSTVRCEDFKKVQQGTLPQGWLGGAGLAVMPSPDFNGGHILTKFEPKDAYKIDVPWSVSGDFVVTLYLAFGCANGACARPGAGERAYGVGIGSINIGIRDMEVSLQNSDAAINVDRGFHWVHINKKGNVYTVVVDGQGVLLGRYDNIPPASSIIVTGGSGGFELAGIRLETIGGVQPAQVAPKEAAATPDEAFCKRFIPINHPGANVTPETIQKCVGEISRSTPDSRDGQKLACFRRCLAASSTDDAAKVCLQKECIAAAPTPAATTSAPPPAAVAPSGPLTGTCEGKPDNQAGFEAEFAAGKLTSLTVGSHLCGSELNKPVSFELGQEKRVDVTWNLYELSRKGKGKATVRVDGSQMRVAGHFCGPEKGPESVSIGSCAWK